MNASTYLRLKMPRCFAQCVGRIVRMACSRMLEEMSGCMCYAHSHLPGPNLLPIRISSSLRKARFIRNQSRLAHAAQVVPLIAVLAYPVVSMIVPTSPISTAWLCPNQQHQPIIITPLLLLASWTSTKAVCWLISAHWSSQVSKDFNCIASIYPILATLFATCTTMMSSSNGAIAGESRLWLLIQFLANVNVAQDGITGNVVLPILSVLVVSIIAFTRRMSFYLNSSQKQ